MSAYEITGLTIVYSTVYSGADQRKHQRSASLAFVRGIHRWPVNSPYAKDVSIWWRHHAVAEGINIIHVYAFCLKINNQTFNILTGNTFEQWNGKYSVVLHIDLKTQMTTHMKPRQNGRHFADAIFKCTFLNENVWIPITISLKFVPQGPINNIPSLVQIMTWRRPGDKPLFGPIMVRLPTHICVTRPQWVNVYWLLSVTYRGFGEGASLNLEISTNSFQGMTCNQKPLTGCLSRWCVHSGTWSIEHTRAGTSYTRQV